MPVGGSMYVVLKEQYGITVVIPMYINIYILKRRVYILNSMRLRLVWYSYICDSHR